MSGRAALRTPSPGEVAAFARVHDAASALPGVGVATKYDGSPVLRVGGVFLAGIASHRSAEPETLVVRMPLDDREALLEDAPEIYYVTAYYAPHPVVLVRLSRVDARALRDLLATSHRLAVAKSPRARRTRRPAADGDYSVR